MRRCRFKSWDLINWMAGFGGYKTYLEVGVGRGRNFNKISIPDKCGVDPNCDTTFRMTSDDFFKSNRRVFDAIFIDGLHHAVQVLRDISNSLSVLNPGGAIVIHDCNPQTEEQQVVPQASKIWTGDVWKAWVILRATRSDLNMAAIDMCRLRCGCGVIQMGHQEPLLIGIGLDGLNWKSLETNRSEWLNLVSLENFKVGFLSRKNPEKGVDGFPARAV